MPTHKAGILFVCRYSTRCSTPYT